MLHSHALQTRPDERRRRQRHVRHVLTHRCRQRRELGHGRAHRRCHGLERRVVADTVATRYSTILDGGVGGITRALDGADGKTQDSAGVAGYARDVIGAQGDQGADYQQKRADPAAHGDDGDEVLDGLELADRWSSVEIQQNSFQVDR